MERDHLREEQCREKRCNVRDFKMCIGIAVFRSRQIDSRMAPCLLLTRVELLQHL